MSYVKIVVTDGVAKDTSGVGKDGRPWARRTQECLVHFGGGQISKEQVRLEPGQPAYPIGEYTLSEVDVRKARSGFGFEFSLSKLVEYPGTKTAFGAVNKAA